MKIAIIVNAFPKLSETFIFNKVMGLINEGADVWVISHQKSNDLHYYQEQLKDKDVKIINAHIEGKSIKTLIYIFTILLFNIPNVLKLWKKTKKCKGNKIVNILKLLPFYTHKFDIIHFEYSGLAVQYLEIMDFIDGKKMISCRGSAELIKPLWDNKRAKQLQTLVSKIDKTHCVSDNMKNTMMQFGLKPEDSFVNNPSIDINYFKRTVSYPENNGKITLASTGRLIWLKGYNYAILGIKKVVEQGINVKYHIIGNGEGKEELTFLIKKLGLENHVFLDGALPRNEIKKKLEKTDIFLLPSLSEGISNSALEAMAMEIPVISTKAGGMEEVIQNNESGIIINEMQPQEIADKIIELTNSRELRIELGKNARKMVEKNLSLTRQIDIFYKQYKSLSNEHQEKN